MSTRTFRINVSAPETAAWFNTQAERTWEVVGVGASTSSWYGTDISGATHAFRKGTTMWDVRDLYRPTETIINYLDQNYSYNGGASDYDNGRLYWGCNGGHSIQYYSNAVYRFNLNQRTPAWELWSGTAADITVATSDGSDNGLGCYGPLTDPGSLAALQAAYVVGTRCGSPRNLHGYYSQKFHNGRFWIPTNTGFVQGGYGQEIAGLKTTAMYSIGEGELGKEGRPQWTYHGKAFESSPGTLYEGHYVALDRSTGKIWCTSSAPAAPGPNLWSIDTTVPLSAPAASRVAKYRCVDSNGRAFDQDRYPSVIIPPRGGNTNSYMLGMGFGTLASGGWFRVINLSAPTVFPTTMPTVSIAAGSSGTWLATQDNVQRSGLVWSEQLDCAIHWQRGTTPAGTLHLLRVPADPMTGAYEWHDLAPVNSAWTPVPYPLSEGQNGIWSGLQVVKINGREAVVVTMKEAAPVGRAQYGVYVYKLPLTAPWS